MARVLNLPLRREQWAALTAGERTISLPNTSRTLRLLYEADGRLSRKPYQRVNLRLGVSGKPRQFEISRIGWTGEGESLRHTVTLGAEVQDVPLRQWLGVVEVALLDITFGYIESARGYCAAYGWSEYKRACRGARDIIANYEHQRMYSPLMLTYRDELEGNRLEMAETLRGDIVEIWRSTRAFLVEHYPEATERADMLAEALLGVVLCRLLVLVHRAYKTADTPDGFARLSAQLVEVFDTFAAPYELPTEYRDKAADILLQHVHRSRAITTLMTN